jgi:hypothetical protein
MKKLITILTLTLMLGFSSCKQDWVCQCVVDNSTTVTNTPINGGTFCHAERTCHGMGNKCQLLTEGR